ncbi:MAG: S-layer protein [Candidatus Diapherotrites archaeon]|uniref:S-layer protein n=1 Tax=Candidatus Iainarchaeum sp. TaxID=3101447 RepID=A0A8T5GDP1_9ARCH|nr:S-layer protein [Candidatus Diapherotrites archaeon]MBT7240966.1 S-layer protein [Candidatus Diapherotrites archaeon]
MKGLSIKKIAAIGIGAALVGSALAPVVSAEAFNNLDTLAKSDVVSDAGVPVVDVVVGGSAAISDVVWAGNIAARVAQLATKPSTGDGTAEVTDGTADISVGGVQSTTGSGNTDENVMDFTASVSEFAPIKADYSDSSQFANISGRTIKVNGTESQINIDENVQATLDVDVQTIADGISPGATVAKVSSNGIVYSLNLGSGLQYAGNGELTNLDANSANNMKIPLLGQEYVVDTISSTKLVLYADTTPTELAVGETVEVAGVGDYEGKTLTVKLIDLVATGGGTTAYQAKWALLDGETVLKYVQQTPAYELKDEFGTEYFTESVYVSAAGENVAAGTYTATVRTGSQRIEIRNNAVFPYDSTKTTNPEWKAYVNTASNKITSVQIKNNWAYNQTKTETTNAKFALAPGESVMLPSDYAKVEYKGPQTKAMAKAMVGGDSFLVTDSKGIQRTIPMVINLGQGTNTFEIAGSTYLLDVNTAATGYVDGAVRYWKKPASVVAEPWNNPTGTSGADYYTSGYTTKDVNAENAIGFEVDADWKSGNVDYYFGGDETTGQYWLFLAAQVFDLDSKSDTIQNELKFVGTDVDQNVDNGGSVVTTGGFAADLNYYLPDSSTYNVLTVEAYDRDTNVETAGQVLTGDFVPSAGNTLQYTSAWVLTDGSTYSANTAPASSDVNFFVNNQDGLLINSQDNKTKSATATAQAVSGDWTVSLDEHSTSAASKLMNSVTKYGTEVSVASGVATILMPEETRKVEAYVGSTDTVTTTTGGESFTDVAVGDTVTTTGGTKVTVDAIGATATGVAGGVEVVAAGDLVKVAGAFSGGKSIIVGGFNANTAAKNLQVTEGNTLEDMLVASGDTVAAVLSSGDIVAAGFTAADTGVAAGALIDALEALI